MSLLWGREGVGWAPAFHPVPGRGWPPLWRRGRVFDPASACVCVGPTCETAGCTSRCECAGCTRAWTDTLPWQPSRTWHTGVAECLHGKQTRVGLRQDPELVKGPPIRHSPSARSEPQPPHP